VITVAVLYNVFFVIARSVFWVMTSKVWMVFDYTADVIYLVDLFVRMHEAYLEQGLIVKDAKKLRIHYAKNSVLPTDLFFFYTGVACHEQVPCPVVLRLNRVLRVDRMFAFFKRTETRTTFPNAFRMSKIILYIVIINHWNASFFFATSFYIGFESDGWVYGGRPDLASQYVYCFHWSTQTLTTIAETAQPVRDIEYLYVSLNMLGGVLFFATIVGNIGAMISNMNAAKDAFNAKVDCIKAYLVFRKTPKELETRLPQDDQLVPVPLGQQPVWR